MLLRAPMMKKEEILVETTHYQGQMAGLNTCLQKNLQGMQLGPPGVVFNGSKNAQSSSQGAASVVQGDHRLATMAHGVEK